MIGKRRQIMGILNVTPDSFSDAGEYSDISKAVARAESMAEDGADIIDIGGESTRPGAGAVGADEEIDRVIPVIERVIKSVDLPISIDTRKSRVARQAIKAGARIVNDVSGLRYDDEMASVVAKEEVYVIIMHMRGTPQDMQNYCDYKDLVGEVMAEIRSRVDIAIKAGIKNSNIVIDPGLGFAKSARDNYELLRRLGEFKAMGYPLCLGTSRKSFIRSALAEADKSGILAGTIASCVMAAINGADILRVHDVKEIVAAMTILDRILKEEGN